MARRGRTNRTQRSECCGTGDSYCWRVSERADGVDQKDNARSVLPFHECRKSQRARARGKLARSTMLPLEIAAAPGPRRRISTGTWGFGRGCVFSFPSIASQIGAAVSDQSRVLSSREELEARVRRFTEATPGEVPTPAFWRGFRVVPERIEFWISGDDRLHDRFLFTREGERWEQVRLFP